MSKILSVNDIAEAITLLPEQFEAQAQQLVEELEDVTQRAAELMAEALGVDITSDASNQPEFGGLCVAFGPKEPGQECPDLIDQGDPDGDWE